MPNRKLNIEALQKQSRERHDQRAMDLFPKIVKKKKISIEKEIKQYHKKIVKMFPEKTIDWEKIKKYAR